MELSKAVFAVWLIGLGFFNTPAEARARVFVEVSLSAQTMHISVDGQEAYVWPVSTGRRGHRTPAGTYHPYWLDQHHRSKLYHDVPMPYSVFFNGDIAIHGTNEVSRLGHPASHGCVRLATKNAATLFKLVRKYGMKETDIVVTN